MNYRELLDLAEMILILRGASAALQFKNWKNSTIGQRQGRDAVNNAIKAGTLKRASTKICYRCRKRRGTEYHHVNGYSEGKKLSVRAVCYQCHAILTKRRKI